MSEYLSKEEIMQWRRSIEKCTLEEYAARLGKKLETEKETHDLIDIINNGENVVQVYNLSQEEKSIKVYVRPKTETPVIKKEETLPKVETPKVETIIDSIVETEPEEIQEEPVKVEEIEEVQKTEKIEKVIKAEKIEKVEKQAAVEEIKEESLEAYEGLNFNKPLTDREKKVFEHFVQNKGKVIFAKDIADLLNLKRDYIYKYIKNLRSKIIEDVLTNSDEGGFIFKI